MLLSLEKLIAKYSMKITGVIHAGSHIGQEASEYYRLGIYYGYFFEPCETAFSHLFKTIYLNDNYVAVNVALGSYTGNGYIFTESKNNGQSNSLLKPKLHEQYYPDITFEGGELVDVYRLDEYKINNCNLLVADVQGYELEVLKGATETLRHIDYIITEVNREELYEGCAMVEDLDNYLSEFKRVETKWKRKGWGDALYISKKLQ